jgi:hypothetical protein
MKKRDVVLGQVYAVKVSGRIAESRHGGWIGRNEQTGREIRIRSAAKLRARLEKIDGKWRPAAEPRPADQNFQQGLTDQGVPY